MTAVPAPSCETEPTPQPPEARVLPWAPPEGPAAGCGSGLPVTAGALPQPPRELTGPGPLHQDGTRHRTGGVREGGQGPPAPRGPGGGAGWTVSGVPGLLNSARVHARGQAAAGSGTLAGVAPSVAVGWVPAGPCPGWGLLSPSLTEVDSRTQSRPQTCAPPGAEPSPSTVGGWRPVVGPVGSWVPEA